MKKNTSILILLLACCITTYAQQKQKNADTTAMLKEFSKSLAFANEPYLYYDAIIKMTATPILEPQDTMELKALFYKNDKGSYASNSIEETLIEDSFEVEINNDRKTIWISKVNPTTEANQLPISEKELQKLLRNKYAISKTEEKTGFTKISFESNQVYDSISNLKTILDIYYDSKKYLPKVFEMTIASKQQLSEQNVAELKSQGTSIKDLIKIEDDYIFMVRSQKMTMTFLNIESNKDKAMHMPSWKSVLLYNKDADEFTIKNEKYAGYEITKTY